MVGRGKKKKRGRHHRSCADWSRSHSRISAPGGGGEGKKKREEFWEKKKKGGGAYWQRARKGDVYADFIGRFYGLRQKGKGREKRKKGLERKKKKERGGNKGEAAKQPLSSRLSRGATRSSTAVPKERREGGGERDLTKREESADPLSPLYNSLYSLVCFAAGKEKGKKRSQKKEGGTIT